MKSEGFSKDHALVVAVDTDHGCTVDDAKGATESTDRGATVISYS